MLDNFFTINPDGTVTYNESLKQLDVIKKLIINSRKNPKGKLYDVGKGARIADEKLSYCYFMVAPNSLYLYNYPDEEERRKKILHGLRVKDWEIDSDVQAVEEFLKEELEVFVIFGLFKSSLKAAFATKGYLDKVDYELKDLKGGFLYKPNDVIKNLEKLAETINGIEALEKRYKKEGNARKTKIRGNTKLSIFELPIEERR
jgi:hypothetical protein